jgi:large-conductance mechanosensitive channel
MNIISQELRFDKKLNYYSPLEFIHRPSDKKEEVDNGDEDGFPVVYIVAISVVGFIIILAIIFLVIRYCKRKGQDSDLSRKTRNLKNEKLMEDI